MADQLGGDPVARFVLIGVVVVDSRQGRTDRAGLKARYAERSGRDLAQLDFFVALGYWKLAIILEGVYSRYAAGQYGKTDQGIDEFAKSVEDLANAAAEAEARLG